MENKDTTILRDNKGRFIKGSIPHSKGKTKKDYEPLKRASENISKTLKRFYKEGKLTNPNKGKKLLYLTERNLLNNPSKIPEIRKKQSETRLRLLKEGKIKSWNKGKKCPQLSGKNNGFYGKKHSKEVLRKRSEKVISNGTFKKVNNPFYRKHHTIENKEIMKFKKLGEYVGSNNPNWLGGKSFEPYTMEFNNKLRRIIRKRDNYVCVLCGKHQEKCKKSLDIHHINYDKKLSILQNCISLCTSCHMKTNFNRKHWTKFFQGILAERYGYKYSENEEVILEIKNDI